jgi:hypothetical protein
VRNRINVLFIALFVGSSLILFVTGYYLVQRSKPFVQVKSKIPGLTLKLTNKERLLGYLNSWNAFGANGIGSYPAADSGAEFESVRKLVIEANPEQQPYGLTTIDNYPNGPIVSYNMVIDSPTARLIVYLNREYWCKVGQSGVNQLASAFILAFLYQTTHFPPRETWEEIHESNNKLIEETISSEESSSFVFSLKCL